MVGLVPILDPSTGSRTPRSTHNRGVLFIGVYRQLTALVSGVHQVIASVETRAAVAEVELRINRSRAHLDTLQTMIGVGPTGPFNNLARHLHWLLHYYREDKPDGYKPDIQDLQNNDLPGVIHAVEQWAEQVFDAGLVTAVAASWEAQHYDSAVRDAFIYLEDVLRHAADVDPSRGLSGERLVTEVLGPNGAFRAALASNGFMGDLTDGEVTGAYHFVRGAFLLFRNATAHRRIPYTLAQAEEVMHLVNLCVRVLIPTRASARMESSPRTASS